MADKKAEYKEASAGQQKLHKVRTPQGDVLEMTQEQWRQRDKNAGLVRVDEDGTEVPETEAGETADEGSAEKE